MLIERAEVELQLSCSYLLNLSARASHSYRELVLCSRSGGRRIVHHPVPELKCLQRWLCRAILAKLEVSHAAYAYRSGLGIADHARQHVKKGYLLRIDFSRFFPSITRADIVSYMSENSVFDGWSDNDREFFLAVVLRFGRLTIGAPSSPSLSNAVCIELDRQLDAYCRDRKVVYTRYADDLYFSSSTPGVLNEVEGELSSMLRGLPYPRSLRINTAKTRYGSKRGRRVVTGVILASDESVSVGRRRKRLVRSLLFRVHDMAPKERVVLAGRIAAINAVEPEFGARLRQKYPQQMTLLTAR